LYIGMPVQLRIVPLFSDDEGREVLVYAFQPLPSSPEVGATHASPSVARGRHG